MASEARDPNRPRGERLDSWKAIAQYLQRDRSTVIRWERESGLPIRRVPGGSGRSVFAYTAEIDDWLATHEDEDVVVALPGPSESSTNPSAATRRTITGRWVYIAAILAAAVASLVVVDWMVRPDVSSARLVGRSIVAFDSGGRELWSTEAPTDLTNVVAPIIKIVDIDRDGRPEILAAFHYFQAAKNGYGQIVVLDNRGQVRWAQSIGDAYRFGDTTYGPGWFPDDVIVHEVSGATRITAAFHHQTWWPDVIVSFDTDGTARDRFVHAGWITGLNTSADGRWLLASGVSNAFAGAALLVLDTAHMSGTAPLADGALPACGNCPAGEPAKYVVVPWSDLAHPSAPPPIYTFVGPSGAIELRAVQRPPPTAVAPELIISFDAGLELTQRSASDGFAETHRMLERSGELTHAFEACPSRTPAVRLWTPAGGWSAYR